MTSYEIEIRRMPDKKTRTLGIHSSYGLDRVYELIRELVGDRRLKGGGEYEGG